MKVRVSYTVDVDDSFRRGINRWYGKEGLASREEVKRWFEAHGRAMDDDISWQEQDAATEPVEPDISADPATQRRFWQDQQAGS